MKVKTTILLRDSLLLLLYTCCWLLTLLTGWTLHTFTTIDLVLTIILNIVLRRRKDIFGIVRYFMLWLLLAALFILQRPDMKYSESGFDNFKVLPSWLKLVYVVIFLLGAAILISKIYENGKLSETKSETV